MDKMWILTADATRLTHKFGFSFLSFIVRVLYFYVGVVKERGGVPVPCFPDSSSQERSARAIHTNIKQNDRTRLGKQWANVEEKLETNKYEE